MLMLAFGAAVLVLAFLRGARGFALGAAIVFFARALQPDHGSAIGFLNTLGDTVALLTGYAALGAALLLLARVQRTMKAFSRS